MNVEDFPGRPQFVHFFHFDRENNLPTLYSIFLFVQASIVCLVISRSSVSDQKYWLLLAIIFALLSIDEFVSIHERLDRLIRITFSTTGFFHFAWIIPAGILVMGLGFVLLGWMLRLPKQTRTGFGLSALLFLTGVFLLEGLEGMRASIVGQDDLLYNLIATAEESLEMLGLIAFTYFAAKFLLAESDDNRVEVRIVDV